VESFTVRFKERDYDEGGLARRVADKWALTRHELTLDPEDVHSGLADAAWLNDEPLAHASDIHLREIAGLAKSHVTVLLSGEGADELLGGYVRYEPLRHPRLIDVLRPGLRLIGGSTLLPARIRKLARFLRLDDVRALGLFNACDVLPDDLRALGMPVRGEFAYRQQVWSEAERLYPHNLMRQAMFSDQHTFLCSLLDRNDRMTMGASIECRVPFLDYRLVEGVAALPSKYVTSRRRKALLRDALGHRLPAAVLKGNKWGFGVPWSQYLRGSRTLRTMVEALPDTEPVRNGPFNRAALKATIRDFLAGRDAHAALVRQLLMIAAWHEAFFGRHARRLHAPSRSDAECSTGEGLRVVR
jgi:asparagine synthase (glutamine-hydrolysing)